MKKPQPAFHRLVVCQGSVQLATALAAIRRHDAYWDTSRTTQSLVVCGLYAPAEQEESFARVITGMASGLADWERIAFVPEREVFELGEMLKHRPVREVMDRLKRRLQIPYADEIFISRDWLLPNDLLLNAYPEARRICYGDGIGFYFSPSYGANGGADRSARPRPVYYDDITTAKSPLRFRALGPVRELKHWAEERMGKRGSLLPLHSELGYFLLPQLFGETPPMPWVQVEPHYLVEVLADVCRSLRTELPRAKLPRLNGGAPHSSPPLVVCLTSNLSEAHRLPLEAELQAYREYLLGQPFPSGARLILKPHPRERAEKVERLAASLGADFGEVEIWRDEPAPYLPFEAVLSDYFAGPAEARVAPPLFVTFGTSALSLSHLFGVKPQLGFGERLIRKYFPGESQSWRLRFEGHLRTAIQSALELPGRDRSDSASLDTASVDPSEVRPKGPGSNRPS